MIYKELIAELQALGTEQNRKTYERHGVKGAQFGISFADLDAVAKRNKKDHTLALRLWESGNHDARMLATRLANAEKIDLPLAEAWVKDLDNYIITDAFSELISDSPLAQHLAETWRVKPEEWVSATGWNITARMAMQPQLNDMYFESVLRDIETGIHKARNRTRYSMNNALIAIGIRGGTLQQRAIQAARSIGKVQVDHGQTSCKTPEAEAYILKTVARRGKRQKVA